MANHIYTDKAKQINVLMEPESLRRLEGLCKSTGKRKGHVIDEALKFYEQGVKHVLTGGQVIFVPKKNAAASPVKEMIGE